MGTRQGTGRKYRQRMYINPERLGWNLGKNSKLKEERGVSFEEVRDRIGKQAYRIVRNPGRNHPGQLCLLVTIHGALWRVPFRKHRDHVHLLTIMRAA